MSSAPSTLRPGAKLTACILRELACARHAQAVRPERIAAVLGPAKHGALISLPALNGLRAFETAGANIESLGCTAANAAKAGLPRRRRDAAAGGDADGDLYC